MHPGLIDAGAAIEKSLRPHISGTFEEGLTGSDRNAGFGLFAISELAKLTGGRLLVASRGAAFHLWPDAKDMTRHHAGFVQPKGVGFPGTLVAFELPLATNADFAVLMEQVKERARLLTPVRNVHRWIRFEGAPSDAAGRVLVRVLGESAVSAEKAGKALRLNIISGDDIVVDFEGVEFVTQSFLHALLFKLMRLAWAEQHPVYAINAKPAVQSALETLENYALSG